jgi:hypothetical protein
VHKRAVAEHLERLPEAEAGLVEAHMASQLLLLLDPHGLRLPSTQTMQAATELNLRLPPLMPSPTKPQPDRKADQVRGTQNTHTYTHSDRDGYQHASKIIARNWYHPIFFSLFTNFIHFSSNLPTLYNVEKIVQPTVYAVFSVVRLAVDDYLVWRKWRPRLFSPTV